MRQTATSGPAATTDDDDLEDSLEAPSVPGGAGEDAEVNTAAAAGSPPGPPRPPTREELRQKIRKGLMDGSLAELEVLADIYASQYHFERTVLSFIDAVGSSKMGQRMMRRFEKQIESEGFNDGP